MSSLADATLKPETLALPAAGFPGGFTVLMAVYRNDDARLFARAIESVEANSLRPDDFVLVVDGPIPEELEAIVREHVARGTLRAVRLPANVGLAAALNAGLAEIRTEWVVRADADDVNTPTRFERQAVHLESLKGEVDVIGGAISEVDPLGHHLAVRAVPLGHEQIARRIRTRNPFNHMTVAFRTAAAREVGGYPGIYLKEDYGLWAKLLQAGARCSNLPEVLVFATTGRDMYRRRGGLRYARSEWHLQRHLRQTGRTGPISAVLFGSARAAAACIPSAWRGWLYEHFLRRRPR